MNTRTRILSVKTKILLVTCFIVMLLVGIMGTYSYLNTSDGLISMGVEQA